MATPYYLQAPAGDEAKPSFWQRLSAGIDRTPSESLYSLASALSQPGPFGRNLTQGLVGFGKGFAEDKKRKGLSSAFDSMASQIPEQMRPIFDAARDDPEMQRALMGGMVSKMVGAEKQDDPFSGTGVESSALNIVIKGQKDQSLRASPEFLMAWRKLTEPQIIRDAAGNMSLYTPPPPKGMLPPMALQQGGMVQAPSGTQAPPRQFPPSGPTGAPMPPPPSRAVPPRLPAGIAPDSPGQFFDPDKHAATLGDGMLPPEVVSAPGGGTIAALPGTSPVGSEEAKQIRQAINTTIPSVKESLKEYRASLNQTGQVDRLFGIGPANAAAKSNHTNLLLQLKELFNLGVLNGPDYELMLKMVGAPDSFDAFIGGRKSLDAQLGATEKYLDAKINEWNERAKAAGIKGMVPTGKAKAPSDDPLGIR